MADGEAIDAARACDRSRDLGAPSEFSRDGTVAAKPRDGATPGRMLDVPLADRNSMLVGAGYAPVYGERPLGAPELEHVRRALEFTLRQQEPYPALVMDGYHDIVMRNDASRRIFEIFRGPVPANRTINGLRTVFDPNGLRPYIVNWDEMAECLMQGLQRQIVETGSDRLMQMRDELLGFPACQRGSGPCARCGRSRRSSTCSCARAI